MQDRRWEQIETLFQRALELPVANREGFLNDACGADEALRAEVESLLSFYDPADSFIEAPVSEVAAELVDGIPAVKPGQRIGHFRIVRRLAHGGMGTVYLAVRDDDQYQKQVAIKLVKSGEDSEFILKRFLNERQILANLEHPNIARLLDGGTTPQGLPYFVMEYVEGEPIDSYCDEHGLSTVERLHLFLKVCSAVQYAHQNLVIHLDIKPNNILVEEDGTPKLLDFGIAKLLQPQSGLNAAEGSMTLHQIMTPEFASPEQVRHNPISTASDVYSLGVLLYRLLTGHRPYRLKSHSSVEIQEAICNQEPEKPSAAIDRIERLHGADGGAHATISPDLISRRRDGSRDRLRKKLAGDIDHILLKALRKEPQRRYTSAGQFSEDVQRHLEGRPVAARQGAWTYRSYKFIRRHKVGVAAAALIVLTLSAGIVSTVIERNKAEKRFNQVRKLANSFMFQVEDEIDKGPTKAKEMLVKTALQYLDSLAQEADNDISLQRELASAYERVGRIQGNSYYPNLGDTQGALASYRKSLELRQRVAEKDPSNPDIRNELADSYEGMGDVLYTMDDLPGGLQNYQTALSIRQPLSAANPKNVTYLQRLADVYGKIGDIKGLDGYPNLGDTHGALANYQLSLAIHEKLLAADPHNRDLQLSLAKTLTSIGMLLRVTGDVLGAVNTVRRGVKILESLALQEPSNAEYRTQLLASYDTLRYVLYDIGEGAEALLYDRKTLSILQPMSDNDPQNTYLRRSLSVTYNSLGRDLLKMGNATEALQYHLKALAISEELSKANPTSGEHLGDIAFTLQCIGDTEAVSHQFTRALQSYRNALAVSKKMLSANPSNVETRDDVSISYAGTGNMLAATGDTAGALDAFHRAIPLAEAISAQSPQNIRYRGRLAQRYFEQGNVYSQRAQTLKHSRTEAKSCWQKAKNQYQRSLEIWQDMQKNGTLNLADVYRPVEAKRALTRVNLALAKLP